MELPLYFGLFVIALAALLWASDKFIDSAEAIGLSLGISPFIIGVTIVAFGTSLPELATSISAVLEGDSKIVVGNVVGSNITNIALVLGLVAVAVKQIDLDYNVWHIDMPYLWGSAFFLYFVLMDFHLSVFECLLFITAIIIFLAYSFKGDEEREQQEKIKTTWRSYVMLLIGGIGVAAGAHFTIEAITQLSLMANIDSDVISLSAVALGTSLPEVIVSLNAARKGKTSIAVGNVLGSNIFNTYCVMAIPGLMGTLEIPTDILTFSLPLMIVMTVLFGIMSSNKKITRWEGMVLLLFYLFFIVDLFSRTLNPA